MKIIKRRIRQNIKQSNNTNKPIVEELSDKRVIIQLNDPLHTLGGQEFRKLTLDFSQIKTRDFALISRIEARLKGASDSFSLENMSKAASTEWRLAFSWVAAIRGTKGVCVDDIDNLSIIDAMELSKEALPFLVRT